MSPPPQSVFVITYRPPDNPEYKDFQKELHARAQRDFGVHLEPSLPPPTACLQLVAYYNGTAKDIIWSQTEKIHWPSGGPPLDNPPCVFSTDDPSCHDGTSAVIATRLCLDRCVFTCMRVIRISQKALNRIE
ncbi:Atrial natriuretic peptide receptor 2 [Liparis tanakae]|uniref:Atrial natriuretic peptide receptor 2 n=1 Tax=Liparis tanakae TaxID=230148 RepID=A0A4Z2H265_9TELE|nr:Atrial natriuretic peptide receptor 2 [Liparis tanakae]